MRRERVEARVQHKVDAAVDRRLVLRVDALHIGVDVVVLFVAGE